MDNCSLYFSDGTIQKAIEAKFGPMKSKAIDCLRYVSEDGDFKPEFKEWYKTKFKKELNLTKRNIKSIAEKAVQYYNETAWKIDEMTEHKNEDTENGYYSVADYERGKAHVVNTLQELYDDIEAGVIDNEDITIDFVKQQAVKRWNKHIFNLIASKENASRNEIEEEFNSLGDDVSVRAWIKEKLSSNGFGIVEQNLLAVWDELNADPASVNKYLKDVLADPKLNGLFTDNAIQDDIVDNQKGDTTEVDDGSRGEDGVSSGVIDDTDKAITQANSHMGDHVTFTKHLDESPRLKHYFNSLKKLADTKKDDNQNYIEDTDNTFGLAETMSTEECAKMLYSESMAFGSQEQMLEAIRRIAASVPGFECFVKLADDLEKDPDLLNELKSIFSKTRVSKMMLENKTVGTRKINIVRESNSDSSKDSTMLFDLRNDVRFTIPEINHETVVTTITPYIHKNDGSDLISQLKVDFSAKRIDTKTRRELEKRYNEALKVAVDSLRTYFPSLSEDSILKFIIKNNNAGEDRIKNLDNISAIIERVNSVTTNAIESKKAWDSIQAKLKQAKEHNAKVRAISSNQKASVTVSQSDYEDVNEIKNREFITPSLNNDVFLVKDMFKNYSVVQVNFNATNADNKMSSDIINNSMITRLIKLLESGDTELVEKWGAKKLRSHHSRYSNILLEERDARGKIIHRGLFRRVGDGVKCTDDCLKLLKLYLFDGARNSDNGKASTYSKMTSGDFAPTVYGSFFNPTPDETGKKDTDTAVYFLRTPSDAPKTFTIKAPRYDTSDLFTYPNKQVVDKFLSRIIKSIPMTTGDMIKETLGDKAVEANNNSYTAEATIDVLTGKKLMYVTNKIINTVGNKTYSAISVGGIKIIVSGNLEKRGTKQILNNLVIESWGNPIVRQTNQQFGTTVSEIPDNLIEKLTEYYRSQLDKGETTFNGVEYEDVPKRQVNTSSSMFKMVMNKVKQELFDMMNAIDFMFETNEDGSPKIGDDGKPIFKAGFDENSAYDYYHKVGKIFKKVDEHYELTGNVFNSNLLTLVVDDVDENGNIKGKKVRNYLMEALTQDRDYEGTDKINILYGGVDGKQNLKVNKREDKNKRSYPDDMLIDSQQQSILEKAVANFIEDYLNQAQEQVASYRQFIADNTDMDSVANFAMNYFIALSNYDELFEGSTKFYKDSRTLLKRAKEYQGSGVPYGTADYYMADDEVNPEEETISLLTSGYITDEKGNQISGRNIFAGTRLEGLTTRRCFKATTIYNTKQTNHPALEQLRSKLIKDLKVDEKTATELLYGKIVTDDSGDVQYDEKGHVITKGGGFTGTKVNDAQSYITFEEWIRRVAAKGQLRKYLPLIKRILNAEKTGKPVSVSDIKEFIQVQKNFYYDLHYDEATRMEVPRQIKNAELVLVPALIKGTQLEEVYNMMKEAGIDQLNTIETSKAANHNTVTLWDNDGNISAENARNFISSASQHAEWYSYNYLYTQQETPQHMNAKNKAGIQLTKKIIDNIDPTNSNPEIVQAKNDFLTLMSENIFDSYQQLFDALELQYDSNGDIASMNKKVFFEKLREQLEIRGMDKNMYDYVDTEGRETPRMPIVRNDILNTFESVLQSVFNNNITVQRLPGFHAAQVTQVGFRAGGLLKAERLTDEQLLKDEDFKEYCKEKKVAISKNKDGKREVSKLVREHFSNWLNERNGTIKYDSDLLYHQKRNKNGELEYAPWIEVGLPLSALGIDRTKGRWRNMKDDDILKELQEEGLDMFIGYRIPTEGKESACLMKLTRIIPDALGSTIIVPNDWVSQTGSDFDIDSVYGISFNFYTDSEGKLHKIKYNKDKAPTKRDYLRYVMHKIDEEQLPENATTSIKEKREEIKDYRNKYFEQSNSRYNSALQALNAFNIEAERDELYDESDELYDESDELGETEEGDEAFNKAEILNNIIELTVTITKDDGTKTKEKILDVIKKGLSDIKKHRNGLKYENKRDRSLDKAVDTRNLIQELYNATSQLKSDDDFEQQVYDELNSRIKALLDAGKEMIGIYDSSLDVNLTDEAVVDILDDIEDAIEGSGIMSWEEWSALPAERRASRKERDNGILDAMQTIFKNDDSLEEQLSRSNFDDITTAMNEMLSDDFKLEKQNRSPYNIFDQIAYQEDAMSGAELKALSVSLDTFCSVCNQVKPEVRNLSSIYIIYDRGDIDNVDEVVKRYNIDGSSAGKRDDGFFIRHKTYGWTKDNKNVAGKILTSYSAQTSAQSFDAVKEGSVPNVNNYTFGVYKTLANMGVDYNTIISFMAQPGVSEIIRAYNAGHSLFYESFNTPLNEAIKVIATKLGIKYDTYETITSILSKINDTYGQVFKSIYGDTASVTLTENGLYNLPIIASKLRDRLKKTGKLASSRPVEEIFVKQIKRWSRESATKDSNTLYIFTDNTDRDSGKPENVIDPNSPYAKKYGAGKHYPTRTQAVVRGLPNAMPISTQRWYHEGAKGDAGMWHDSDFEEFKKTIDEEIEAIKAEWNTGKYSSVAFGGGDGLFNGDISKLSKERTPKLYDYLTEKYNELVDFVNDNPSNNTATVTDEVIETLFDLGTILQFHKINSIANEINPIRRACTPDKFGAGKSAYAANKLFSDIYAALYKTDTDLETADNDIKSNLRKNPVLTVDGKNMLEAVYPGVTKYGEDRSIKFTSKRIRKAITEMDPRLSSYKTLAAHIKYSTAFSVVVGTELVPTQRPEFVELVMGLGKKLTDNFTGDISEDLYNDFQKYAINFIYNEMAIFSDRWNFEVTNGRLTGVSLDAETNRDEENARIFGYGMPDTIAYMEGEGLQAKEVPFIVKNKNIPTQEEVEAFAKLSPAQKVKWIQANSADAGVFGYLEANLYNPNARRERIGMQTIQFNDTGISLNTVRAQFMNAVNSTNPLVKLAALDLVKYSAKIEGFRLGKTSVSKVIDNAVLYNEFGINGYGFAEDITDLFNNIDRIDSILSREKREELYERYLRSKQDLKEIKTITTTSYTKKRFGMEGSINGMYVMQFTFNPEDIKEGETEDTARFRQLDVWRKNLSTGGFLREDARTKRTAPNSYIRVKDKDRGNLLYKIKDYTSIVYIYPLTNLQQNETSYWSANEDNNKALWHKNIYESVINHSHNEGYNRERTFDIVAEMKDKGEFDGAYYQKRTTPNNPVAMAAELQKAFNSNKDVSLNVAKTEIKRHFIEGQSSEPMYVISKTINSYLFSKGVQYSANVRLDFGDGVYANYRIVKPQSTAGAKKYLGDRLNEGNRDAVYYVAKAEAAEVTGENVPMAATILDLDMAAVDFMQSQKQAFGDKDAVNRLEKLRVFDVTSRQESINNNIDLVTQQIASFSIAAAKRIKEDFEHFMPNPDDIDGEWIPITDDRVQAAIAENVELYDKYLKVLNDIQAFKEKFTGWDSVEAKPEEIDMKSYINSIQNAKGIVEKLDVDKADTKLIEGYITKLSTNPIVMDGLVNIMDGFYKTTGSMWAFHDIMENGNMLLQTILKDVMGDIEAKRYATIRRKEEFRTKLSELMRKAGMTNLSKIIKDDGRFVEDYSPEFVDELERLRDEKNQAASEFGYGSIQFLKAKNNYDAFKATFCNQEAKQDYYIHKAQAEKKMIEDHPVLYEHYMRLYYEKIDLLQYATENGIDDVIDARIQEIDQEMFNLRRDNYYVDKTGALKRREHINQPNVALTQAEKEELELYSVESQEIMAAFVKTMNELNTEYFHYEPVEGFERKLRDNLSILEKFEKRDIHGIPTVPQSILEDNEQYVAAREWIKRNAYYQLSEEEYEDGRSFIQEVHDALARLVMNGTGNLNAVTNILNDKENWINGEDPRDERGVIDASKLKPEAIKAIQDEVARKYKFVHNRQFTDRVIINSAPRNTEVYNQAFYSMMRSNGQENAAYFAKVTEINNILRKYYNELTDTVDFSRMTSSLESIQELQQLGRLFAELRRIHKNIGTTNGKDIVDFIEANVTYETNDAAFMSQFADLSRRDAMFKEAWKKVNLEYDKDGNLVLDEHGQPVPNRFLYSIMKPKDSVKERFLDEQGTADRRLIENVFRTRTTRYYEDTRAEMQRKDEAERKANGDSTIYKDWFMANHIYNPYTHKMEPLPCWTTKEYNDTVLASYGDFKGEWIPKASQREKKVNDGSDTPNPTLAHLHDKRNPNYKPDVSLAENYIKGAINGKYDNPAILTDDEKAVRDFLKETLMQTATTDSARRYFKNGYLPARAKQPGLSDGKTLTKEIAKLFGLGISTNNGNKEFFTEIGYGNDVTPLMPLTKLIRTSDSKTFTEPKPKRAEFPATPQGANEYQAALDEWKAKKKEIDDFNKKIHDNMLDKDWIEVIDDYLDLAGRYNAISDNKLKLYYLLNKLRDQKAFIVSSRDGENLRHDRRKGDKDNPVLDSAVDAELIKQYENFLKRLLFDQWKEESGKLTRYANNLQGFTSANYMMLNFKGGIANVTLGETGILAEAAASEFFSYSDWAKGTAEWSQGIISYGRAFGKDFSYSVQDAIIKALKVVDYDEHTGIVREAEYAKFSKRLRDAMFMPQTMGEHFMQNSVLFAMLHSHKIVKKPGSDSMTFMNQAEYVRTKEAEYLTTLLDTTQLQELEDEKKRLSKDKNELAEYAWFRKDFLNRWAYLNLSKDQRDAFYAKREALRKQSIEEFKKLPDMRSQMTLGNNGKLAFVPGSQLDTLNKNMTSKGVTEAEQLLGEFTQRTRLVNNKIHGVYNRLGAAYIEKTWIGSLIMQYHKHLPMGIMKRYMKRGHYNETRGSVDKGMIWSIWDFLTLNIDKIKHDAGLTDANVGALQSLQMLLGNSMTFLMNMRDTWKFTTEYDKANIKRNLGDLTGVTLAVLTALLLIMTGDDDDDSVAYNLALYEADRLASESFLYNPVGLVNEGKKLMSTPIAAQSVIGDAMSAIGSIAQIILQGEDYDPYYHSGRFAGEHKLSVYIQRRIPMWNGIRGIIEIPDNNHYYKVGKNPITILPLDKIAGKAD